MKSISVSRLTVVVKPEFHADLTSSADTFLRVVWPAIAEEIGGGKIIPIESIADRGMATILDQRSGIDAWHLGNGSRIRGIASRVQWGNKPWNTFTVRYARDSRATTEYEKRKRDIESSCGWLYPHLTIQAYVAGSRDDSGELISAAVVKTEALIDACTRILRGEASRIDGGIRRTSNAEFIWVGWSLFSSNQIKIVEGRQPPVPVST